MASAQQLQQVADTLGNSRSCKLPPPPRHSGTFGRCLIRLPSTPMDKIIPSLSQPPKPNETGTVCAEIATRCSQESWRRWSQSSVPGLSPLATL